MTTEYIPPECCSGWNITFVACSSGKFRKRKFYVTTEFLAKDKRDFTTYFAIAFKPMLALVVGR